MGQMQAYRVENDQQATETKVFLDISSRVVYDDKQNEEGFLGLAFHPKYKENGEFFAFYLYLGLLLGHWCTVTTVQDEQVALRALNGRHYDLVLVNIDTQDSAGLELLERLRASPQRVAVVALTASPFMGEQNLFLDAGFDGYIGLPFPPQAFAPAQALGLR